MNNLFPFLRSINLHNKIFIGIIFIICYHHTVRGQEITARLRTGQISLRSNLSQDLINKELESAGSGNYFYALVAFDRLPHPKALQYARRSGVEFLEKITDQIYSVRFRYKPDLMMFRTAGIKAMKSMPSYLKTTESLASRMSSVRADELIKISVLLYPGENFNQHITFAEQSLGFTLESKQYADQGLFIGTIASSQIERLVALPFVRMINLFDYKMESLLSPETGAFGLSYLKGQLWGGRNLSGEGITVGVGDNADPSSHLDLLNNAVNRCPLPIQLGNHGTRVSGIISGDGLVDESFKGIAPGTKLITDFYDYIITKSPSYKKDFGMTVTNNSYYLGYDKCPGNGAYNELSVFVDHQISVDTSLMHIVAAGNDGTLTCSPYPASYGTIKSGYQTGKNVLSVGNYNIFNPQNISSSSSRGPVNDGRIKPEIIAPGSNFWSTTINNNYNNGFGTSFAAPFIAGVYSLLADKYKQLHNNATPSSALLKAVLCNTAGERGLPGPDYINGYGLVQPYRALEVIENDRYIKGNISQGDQFLRNISIPSGTKRIKIMLYWHDPAGSLIAPVALQHDLDLQVVNNNTTYLPWILNPSPNQVNTAAVRGIDRLNNMEQVTIDNPIGNSLQIQVNGYSIVSDSQDFFITWEFYNDEIRLLYPIGGEKFTPGLNINYEAISWDVSDHISDSLTIEYSTNNGNNWTVIASDVSARNLWHFWTLPNITSANTKVRVRRKSNNAVSESQGTFTILTRPTITSTIPCEGGVNLSWTAVNNATDYEVFQLKNYQWEKLGNTTGLQYPVRGLDKSIRYWFSVRARITDSSGRRARAIAVSPSLNTPCTASEFDKDLKIDQLVSPTNGRKYTASELTNTQEVVVKIKNLDDTPSSASYNVSYQINGGPVITELSNITIPASGTIDYAFATKADLSSVDSFNIKVFVKQAGDLRPENDEMGFVIRHLDNPPVILPHIENFENTGDDEYRRNTFGLKNIERFDYTLSTTNGRARTFVNSGMALSGNKAITLDAAQYLGAININQLIGTYNFSNVSSTDDLRLDFDFKNQGQLNLPSGILWIRGNDDLPWINAYELTNDRNNLGNTRKAWVNIKELLFAAGQPLSSSFQIFFQQAGRTSSNNADYFPELFDLDDGITIDNIRFTKTNNDVVVSQIISPDSLSCTVGIMSQSVTVRIKNLSSNTLTNIPVFYRVGNHAPVQDIIPSLSGNTEMNYTFTTPFTITNAGTYTLDAWVSLPADDYRVNDSIIGYNFFVSTSINKFPYLEKFESNNAGWFTSNRYSSWSWGSTDSLTKAVIKTAANGNKAWFTSLAGAYNSNESSYLYTPCFNISELVSPVLSFSHIYRQERARDVHYLEYSSDNGVSWQKLGVQNTGTNWYDTVANFWNRDIQRWHVSSADLPAGISNIRFRFFFTSDDFTQSEGVGIDDFHIFDKATIYEGQPTNVTQPVSGNDFVHFISQNKIIASINPLGQQLGNVQVSVYINQDSVRLLNNQYYLDRNLVVQAQNDPTDSVLIRFYFTEDEIKKMINTTKCIPCVKLKDAYVTAITTYSGLPEYENGILNDGIGGSYQFMDPSKIEIIPFNNGYYAEYKVKSFSEFWIHAFDYNLSQIPLSVNDPAVSREFIINTLFSPSGQLVVNPAHQRGIHEVNIRLMNAAGQDILHVSRPYQRTLLEVGNIANGIYFITITDKAGKYFYRSKLIK
ncbi:MAG: S8 family serine peptidase [Bacteroidota bacterium]